MSFLLEFDTDNAAFDETPSLEVVAIMKRVTNKIAMGLRDGPIHDTNGNKIGRWELDHEEADHA